MTLTGHILPKIIQGGMGVGVSSWKLAKAVSEYGQLGVVSGTALALSFARKLMDGDKEGHIIAAIDRFPFQKIAQRVKERYLNRISKQHNKYDLVPMPTITQSKDLIDLTVLANYVEVSMAKHGHPGIVGINFLEKIQFPTLPSLYGALLADVDYVLMGAGIPVHMPQLITDLSNNSDVKLPITIANDPKGEPVYSYFSPKDFAEGERLPSLKRPHFLAIVSSATLAFYLHRSSSGSPDGFIIESPIAGGHNAPPRGPLQLNADGEPIYGTRDDVDYEAFQKIGLPFWLAGGFGKKEQLDYALSLGATGVQVGTAFAFCEESGFEPTLKEKVINALRLNKVRVRTDPRASPTGYPFKVVTLEGTMGDESVAEQRQRICDLGYLREAYRDEQGRLGYRCPAEPIDDYLRKGGKVEDTVGRKCLCNGLASALGVGQYRSNGKIEFPLITAGDDISSILTYIDIGAVNYTAKIVLKKLLGYDNPSTRVT